MPSPEKCEETVNSRLFSPPPLYIRDVLSLNCSYLTSYLMKIKYRLLMEGKPPKRYEGVLENIHSFLQGCPPSLCHTIPVAESLPTPRPINWADSARATGSNTSFAFSFLISPIEIEALSTVWEVDRPNQLICIWSSISLQIQPWSFFRHASVSSTYPCQSVS